jgi:hypothetical protein
MSDRRSSRIAGSDVVADRRFVAFAGGSNEDTILARYIYVDIASMAENGSEEKGVKFAATRQTNGKGCRIAHRYIPMYISR